MVFENLSYPTFEYCGKKLKSNKLADLTHTILMKYCFKPEVALHSILLKKKYGKYYNYYINYLKECGALKIVQNHRRGINSNVYTIQKPALEVQAFENTSIKKDIQIDGVIANVIGDLKYGKIIGDISQYLINTTDYAVSKNNYAVDCINKELLYHHIDKYGRLHTNYTNLKSGIRKNLLYIDGEKTCEIDIKNSQPLFFTKIAIDNMPKSYELDFFHYITYNGIFYEYLNELYPNYGKKDIKVLIYHVIFGKNRNSEYDKQFSKHFPEIYKFLKKYKKTLSSYKDMSHILQKMESDFIFNEVIKTIKEVNPDIKVITIHDSIICQEKHEKVVKTILKKCLEKK